MENAPLQKVNQKISYLLIGGIIFVSLGLFFLFKNKSLNINQQKNIYLPTQSQVSPPKKFFKLSLPISEKTFSLNDQINVEVYADSEGKNISGYDILIFYNPQGLEFVSAESTLNDFSLYSFKKGNYITLTGTKKINLNNQTIFTSTKVATVTFKPKRRGKYTVSLLPNLRKEKTQMVDDQTNVYYPSLNQLEIDVQ